MRRYIIAGNWKMNKLDNESIRKTIELLAVHLGKAGRGRILIKLSSEHPWEGSYAANHHIGTTRMSDDPKKGVVNARLTAVRASSLVWPDGITEAEKTAAIKQLKANHIIVR